MRSIMGRAGIAARELLAKRARELPELAAVVKDHGPLLHVLALEAYCAGQLEGVVRAQAAVAQVHARVQSEIRK